MHIKNIVKKKFPWILKVYGAYVAFYASALTVISPTLNTKYRYKKGFGKKIDLKNPQTLNEKILWLKLNKYSNDPLVIQCADKYRVREYIKDCGCGDILNKLYGVYDSADEIPWDSLPNEFVLKWNFGAGMNIICADKSSLDIQKAKKQLKKWGKRKIWLPYSEMQYKYAPKKIICEKFLEQEDPTTPITDYKVYCFHSKPEAILVMHDRGKNIKTEFFDTNWNKLENTTNYEQYSISTPKPECLDQMLKACEILTKPFPFVRCDFYISNGKLYFGELTFTPAGGHYLSQTKIHGKDMSEYL